MPSSATETTTGAFAGSRTSQRCRSFPRSVATVSSTGDVLARTRPQSGVGAAKTFTHGARHAAETAAAQAGHDVRFTAEDPDQLRAGLMLIRKTSPRSGRSCPAVGDTTRRYSPGVREVVSMKMTRKPSVAAVTWFNDPSLRGSLAGACCHRDTRYPSACGALSGNTRTSMARPGGGSSMTASAVVTRL